MSISYTLDFQLTHVSGEINQLHGNPQGTAPAEFIKRSPCRSGSNIMFLLSHFSHNSQGCLQEFHLGLSLLFSLFYIGLSLISPDFGLISPDFGLISPDLGLINSDLGLLGLDPDLVGLDLGLFSHYIGYQARILLFLYQYLKIIKFVREMISLLHHC